MNNRITFTIPEYIDLHLEDNHERILRSLTVLENHAGTNIEVCPFLKNPYGEKLAFSGYIFCLSIEDANELISELERAIKNREKRIENLKQKFSKDINQ